MDDATLALQAKVGELQTRLSEQEKQHTDEVAKLQASLAELQTLVEKAERARSSLEVISGGTTADVFTRRVEWTIENFSSREKAIAKGESIWSPKFRAAGLDSLQLEFFPKGRENTTFDGFCSLFLWCPTGTRLRYQLWVGSFLRAPDEDEYSGRIGHGHSNFCPIDPEVDREKDCLVVGCNFIEVGSSLEPTNDDNGNRLQLFVTPLEEMVSKEAQILQHRNVNRVVWRVTKAAERVKHLPRGASMWSRVFTAAGIREILLEFYPNGSSNTTKDGFCALYIRCPEGVSIIVTLFVGSVRKGPIKTTFDSLTGKGLPDFCLLQDQINEQGTVEVGIEIQNQPSKTLVLET